MDLNALRIFVEVARLGSFTAAAKSLDVAKTSVSNKVQQLEKQLNNRLLERTTRTVSLTEIGSEVFDLAEEMILSAKKIEELADGTLREPQGRLRIAAPSVMVEGFLGAWCIEFRKLYPKVVLQLLATNRNLDFQQEELDFAFRNVSSMPVADLVTKTLFKFRCGYYASPMLIRHFAPVTHPEELRQWPGVGFTVDGKIQPWQFEEQGNCLEFEANTVMRFDDAGLAKRAAVFGLGVTFMSCHLAEGDVRAGRLIPLLPEYWPPPLYTSQLYQDQEHMPLKNRAFIEFVDRKAHSLAPYVS